jgi:hypothetical protein
MARIIYSTVLVCLFVFMQSSVAASPNPSAVGITAPIENEESVFDKLNAGFETSSFLSAIVGAVAGGLIGAWASHRVVKQQNKASYKRDLADAYAQYFSAMAELRCQQAAFAINEDTNEGTREKVYQSIHQARLAVHRVVCTDRDHARATVAVNAYLWPLLSDLEAVRKTQTRVEGSRSHEDQFVKDLFQPRDVDVRYLEYQIQKDLRGEKKDPVRFYGEHPLESRKKCSPTRYHDAMNTVIGLGLPLKSQPESGINDSEGGRG